MQPQHNNTPTTQQLTLTAQLAILQVLSSCKAPNVIQLQPDEEAIGAADLQRICGHTAPHLERTRSTGSPADVTNTGEIFKPPELQNSDLLSLAKHGAAALQAAARRCMHYTGYEGIAWPSSRNAACLPDRTAIVFTVPHSLSPNRELQM
jgi:hypothetical protein